MGVDAGECPCNVLTSNNFSKHLCTLKGGEFQVDFLGLLSSFTHTLIIMLNVLVLAMALIKYNF